MIEEASRPQILGAKGTIPLEIAMPTKDTATSDRGEKRASAQGIADGDLPPVPRGIVEPPPLPPPEAHVKDSRKARKAKGKKRKSGAKKTKGSSSKVSASRKAK